MNNPPRHPGKNWRDLDHPANFICTLPSHQDDYDQLGACLICRVPTINGLHPTARARLLEKRPDLAPVVPQHGSRDANDPEPETPSTPIPPQMASGSGSPNHPVLHWLNPFVQIVGHPGETT